MVGNLVRGGVVCGARSQILCEVRAANARMQRLDATRLGEALSLLLRLLWEDRIGSSLASEWGNEGSSGTTGLSSLV